jgi:aryl-alcohol dehydrogenase-like predicted oxidoreductase
MKYNFVGRTGLLVSELCLGTMTFGGNDAFWGKIGQLRSEAVNGILRAAMDGGINFIDTADVYANGDSERLLGEGLKSLGIAREDVVLATKVFGRMGPGVNAVGLSRHHIMTAVKESLDRLQTDYIDLYQIHGADLSTPIDETLRALDDLVRSGMVRTIGCSNLMAWQVMKALGISRSEHLARFESLQAFYSIGARDIEREIVPMLTEERLGLMVWSPLAGGLMSGKFRRAEEGPADARRTIFDFPPVEKEHAFTIIEAMDPIAAKHGVSVARVALAWLLARPVVTSVIIGAKTVAQVDDNLAAGTLRLDDEDMAQLDAVSALKPEYPGWMVARQNEGRVRA